MTARLFLIMTSLLFSQMLQILVSVISDAVKVFIIKTIGVIKENKRLVAIYLYILQYGLLGFLHTVLSLHSPAV